MTSPLGNARSSYRELFFLLALPGANRGIAAIVLAVGPPLIFAWFATAYDRWDLFERSGSLTSAVGLVLASRRYLGHGILELALLHANEESNMAQLAEDVHTAKLEFALSAFGMFIWGWGEYLRWWSFSSLLVWAAIAALDARRDFVRLRDNPLGTSPAEGSNDAAGPSS